MRDTLSYDNVRVNEDYCISNGVRAKACRNSVPNRCDPTCSAGGALFTPLDIHIGNGAMEVRHFKAGSAATRLELSYRERMFATM